jgi:Uncharacterized conserved protein, contains double-stranded beta-helix domain
MGQRITWLTHAASTSGELLRFEFWMRAGASAPPLHVHPRQEERIEVVSGSVRSVSGGVERVLGPGETISSPPGEPHTVGPAGVDAALMIVEFRPALGSNSLSSAPSRSTALAPQREGSGQSSAHGNDKATRGRVLPTSDSGGVAASRVAVDGPTWPPPPGRERITEGSRMQVARNSTSGWVAGAA